MTLAELEEQLARTPFTPCSGNDAISRGWISPRNDGALVATVGGQWMIALSVQTRILPPSVVDEEVRERATAFEGERGRKPGRKELRELRERVTAELLLKTLTRRATTAIWIDPNAEWFCVDGSSPSKCDEVVDVLGLCLDQFPLKRLYTQHAQQSAMADWLAGGEGPVEFTIDRDCELRAVGEEKAAVRYVNHPLDGDKINAEIKAHLSDGKLPTRLGMTWGDRISFVLTENLELKRIAYLDLIKEQAENDRPQEQDRSDANMALMTGEFGRLLPAVIASLGGEVVEEVVETSN